nr:MAG: nonstructural protein [Microvirus sp.]
MKALYAIFDIAASAIIGGVHVFHGDAPAIRFFGDLVGDPQTMMGRHPKDHQLMCLGHLNEETGVIQTEDGPSVVITGEAMKAAQTAAQENAQ